MSRRLFGKLIYQMGKALKTNPNPPRTSSAEKQKISTNLDDNISMFREALGNSMDAEIREFYMGNTRVALMYLDGIVERTALRENILRALMVDTKFTEPSPGTYGESLVMSVKKKVLSVCCVKKSQYFNKLLDAVLSPNIIMLIDGEDTGLILKLPGYETREISEPLTEVTVRGPREGFIEPLPVNVSMLRRKIKSARLRFEQVTVGRVTKTDLCIAYINDIADPKIVEEVRQRIKKIDIDGVLESGYIEEFLEDAPYSIFPTVGNTEKPDKVAAQLMEGRVAILVDGSPFVLTVPYLFIEQIHSSEDYYSRRYSASFFRMLRLLALITTTCLPAFYIATISYNPEILPSQLLLTIAAAREGTPLPVFFEIIFMGIVFELLREAGVRLPRPVGQAVSIVGALVLGEAAIRAGIVGAPAVIITALTGITSFIVPSQNDAHIFIRLSLSVYSAIAGFYGLFLGMIVGLIHLASLRSVGIPYLYPVAPLATGDLKDSFVRAPWWAMTHRPGNLVDDNRRRVGGVSAPAPPERADKSGGEQ